MIDPRDVKTATDAKQIIQERKLNHLKVGVFDIDGVMRGKYMSREKFLSALDKGFGFCDVVLGWDSNDQLYDSSVTYTGWNTVIQMPQYVSSLTAVVLYPLKVTHYYLLLSSPMLQKLFVLVPCYVD